MDEEEAIQEQIRLLAQNLYKLHLAATYEEAERRAEEIIRNTQGEGKSVEKISDVIQDAAENIDKADFLQE
ncbi:hypothetical protein HY486_04150 [Candidatus Woesearchaeota archaeon]|nr:hypothetical protein [Candidatus Woesearchaeota archaeon]